MIRPIFVGISFVMSPSKVPKLFIFHSNVTLSRLNSKHFYLLPFFNQEIELFPLFSDKE